ncbi:PREDICTED: uncharacterized protein LOC106725150 [Myotis brandtii]|uniref:uncharacterized protein LOC106725150 n=1 Tax=Myotis brandtii TaxID=109478 RepID=UPI0007042E5A|nr:PREDICTED: uncharacterized protein LOC106725150 [Myotis brandtii]
MLVSPGSLCLDSAEGRNSSSPPRALRLPDGTSAAWYILTIFGIYAVVFLFRLASNILRKNDKSLEDIYYLNLTSELKKKGLPSRAAKCSTLTISNTAALQSSEQAHPGAGQAPASSLQGRLLAGHRVPYQFLSGPGVPAATSRARQVPFSMRSQRREDLGDTGRRHRLPATERRRENPDLPAPDLGLPPGLWESEPLSKPSSRRRCVTAALANEHLPTMPRPQAEATQTHLPWVTYHVSQRELF